MGTDPTDQSYEPGDVCGSCWPGGVTPEYVKVVFEGITVPGWLPAIPQVGWICKQGVPCGWGVGVVYDHGDPFGVIEWGCSYIASNAQNKSYVTLINDFAQYFIPDWGDLPNECLDEFDNEIPPGGPVGGSAKVTWGASINENAYNEQPVA